MKIIITQFLTVAALVLLTFIPASILAQKYNLEGIVSDEFGPLSGTIIKIKNQELQTPTNVNGMFSFMLKPGNYELIVNSIGFSERAIKVNLTKDTLVEIFLRPEKVEIGGQGEPVDIISHEEIVNSSRQNLGEVLQYLVPTFHSTHQTIADGTDHIDPISMRGLGPDQVLILINGKRFHTSSLINVNGTIARGAVSTDINAIPVSIIDHIEILKNGASTLYGSDAVAGVINIVLRKETGFTGGGFQVGTTEQLDGTYTKIHSNFGFDIGEKGYIHVSGQFINRDPVNRSGDYTGTVYGDSRDDDLSGFFANTGYSGKRVMSIGSAGTMDASTVINASLPITNNAEIYGYAGSNYRIGEANGFYRFPKDKDRVVPELYPYGFSPKIRTDINDRYFTVGVKGRKGGWLLDLSNTYGSNSLDFTVQNSNNASFGVASPLEAYAGGFRSGQNNTNLDAKWGYRPFSGIDTMTVKVGGLFRHERYEIVPGEPASWEQGTDTTSNGVLKAPGIQVFPGFQPENEVQGDRTNVAGYLGMDMDVSPALYFGATMRYESYKDFGNNFSWKVSGRYMYRWLTFRATYSTGFRAPSIHQVYFNNISLQFIGETPLRVGTFRNNSAVARAFGIPTLKAELAQNLTFGLIYKPFTDKDFSVKVDAYQIDIQDRIVLSGRFSSLDGSGNPTEFFPILEPLGVGATQFFANAINTQTRGIDFSAYYNGIQLGRNTLDLSLNTNFTETVVDPNINLPGLLQGKEEIFFNREEISRLEVASPASKIILIANYNIGKFQIRGQATRFGKVEYIDPADGNESNWVFNDLTGQIESRDQVFMPKFLTDLEVAYLFSTRNNGQVRVALGGHNITNTYPDQHKHSANVSLGRFVYSRRVQQFGVNGFFGFLKVTGSF
ncbi:MAG: TonB-dependent receptor [Bacteroidetes bacterium]|nr:TonB-dependent receptor [Bacteroidota bacterium]